MREHDQPTSIVVGADEPPPASDPAEEVSLRDLELVPCAGALEDALLQACGDRGAATAGPKGGSWPRLVPRARRLVPLPLGSALRGR